MGTPSNVKTGPGRLLVAAVGATEPTDLATPFAIAWTELGYTAEGHSFTHSPSYDPVEVAESLVPIRYEATGIEETVEFALAEMTAENLKRALNGGTVTTETSITTFEPPEAGENNTRIALAWESSDATERYIWRKCLQTGDVETQRRKGADYAQITAQFMVEVPDTGARWVRISDES